MKDVRPRRNVGTCEQNNACAYATAKRTFLHPLSHDISVHIHRRNRKATLGDTEKKGKICWYKGRHNGKSAVVKKYLAEKAAFGKRRR